MIFLNISATARRLAVIRFYHKHDNIQEPRGIRELIGMPLDFIKIGGQEN